MPRTKQYIVIVGTLLGNKTFHGPFDSYEEARIWADMTVENQHYEIAELHQFT